MKIYFATFLLFVSIYAIAQENQTICITNGDCQIYDNITNGEMCIIVKTGVNHLGQATCNLQCHNVELGSYCKKNSNNLFGQCKKEKFLMPVFDPSNPDCSSAIELNM